MQRRYTYWIRHSITRPIYALPPPYPTMLCLCLDLRCRATPVHRCSIQSRSNVMLLLFPSLHLRCPASPLLCSAYHCLTELSMPKHHRTLLCRCYTNFSAADHHKTSLCHRYTTRNLASAVRHEAMPCHNNASTYSAIAAPNKATPKLSFSSPLL